MKLSVSQPHWLLVIHLELSPQLSLDIVVYVACGQLFLKAQDFSLGEGNCCAALDKLLSVSETMEEPGSLGVLARSLRLPVFMLGDFRVPCLHFYTPSLCEQVKADN